ncbi:hypothetical protein CKAN_01837400 [Cinnamomum micranthum f. kanehirae]|uniref:Uncharacterized protein n=1 Tax=Cinnamomum micranthum f. kanehirae TaxID=337451 RepID=A0A3S4PED1_9MAGN|nr:hypothetical protein CKAN_01837400 [Cinnamomum micranthum f. kanehirae]
MSGGNDAKAFIFSVHDNHGRPSRILHNQSLCNVSDPSTLTKHRLPFDVDAIQGAVNARGGIRISIRTRKDDRQWLIGLEVFWLKQGFSIAEFSISKHHSRPNASVHGDQSGCELLSSAAIPLRWGHDMDVPDIMLKVEPKIGNDPTFRGHPARTLTPGPMMSGFRIPGLGKLGPRDENDITIGDGDVPKIVPLKRIIAVGERVEFI